MNTSTAARRPVVDTFDGIGARHLAAARANRLWRETGIMHQTYTQPDGTVLVKRLDDYEERLAESLDRARQTRQERFDTIGLPAADWKRIGA